MRGQKHGAHLGGIRTLEDLKARCRIDGAGCWHLFSSRGAPLPRGRQIVWLHGRGPMTALRAAYELAFGGYPVPEDRVVYRVCQSYDCVCPQHVRRGTRRQMLAWNAQAGTGRTQRKTAGARASGMARSRLSLELRQWIAESPQSGVSLGEVLGISHSWVSMLRKKMREAVA